MSDFPTVGAKTDRADSGQGAANVAAQTATSSTKTDGGPFPWRLVTGRDFARSLAWARQRPRELEALIARGRRTPENFGPKP